MCVSAAHQIKRGASGRESGVIKLAHLVGPAFQRLDLRLVVVCVVEAAVVFVGIVAVGVVVVRLSAEQQAFSVPLAA